MIGHSNVTKPEGVAEERPLLTVTAAPRKYMGALIWIEWMEMPGISLLLTRLVALLGKSRSFPACGIWAGDQFAATLHCTPAVPTQVRRVRRRGERLNVAERDSEIVRGHRAKIIRLEFRQP